MAHLCRDETTRLVVCGLSSLSAIKSRVSISSSTLSRAEVRTNAIGPFFFIGTVIGGPPSWVKTVK